MYYDKEIDKCRTPKVNFIFGLIGEISMVLGKKEVGQKGNVSDLSHLVPQEGDYRTPCIRMRG